MWTRAQDFDRMFGTMDLLRNRMNRIFNDFDRSYGEYTLEGGPRTNLYDTGDKLRVTAEVPGIARENLSIRIQGNYLELSGSRKAEAPAGYKAHRVEREATSFTRSFTLPVDVDADRAEATVKDGILILELPKAEAAKPRQITIK